MEWLCQDCLAITVSDGEPVCRVCGGETCACGACVRVIDLLQAGCRNHRELGLSKPIKGWTVNGESK